MSHGDKSANASAKTAGQASSAAHASAGSAKIADGSTINAVLEKPVDVKKNKPGDQVVAKVTQNVKGSADSSQQVVIPKGSRLVGHVTEAKPRDKSKKASAKGGASAKSQADSVLGIAFDKAILKNGQEIPLNATIQAVGSAQQALAANAGNNSVMESTDAATSGSGVVGGRSSGGGLLGGATGTVGSTVGTTTSAVGNTAGTVGNTAGGVVNSTTSVAGSTAGTLNSATTTSGQLTSSAHGVVGLQGLQLASEASNATQGSLITSSTRDVKLDSGSQMVLKVAGSAH